MTETRASTHTPHYPVFWRRTSVKISLAFLVFAAFMAWNYAHRPAPSPTRAGHLGPEWECDPTSPAHLCLKDVRIVRPDSIMDKPRAGQQ